MLAFSLVGMALILAWSARRGFAETDLLVALAIPITLFMLAPLKIATVFLCPTTMDAALRHIDLLLGLDGFAVTRWLVRNDLYFFVPAAYASLPLVIAIAWIAERSHVLLRACVIGAIASFFVYITVPAAGPVYAFHGFPAASAVAILPGAYPRNCFPSMHVGFPLLVVLNARGWCWRAVASIWTVLIAVAAVAIGQHYVIDEIAAVLFSLAVQYTAVAIGARQILTKRATV